MIDLCFTDLERLELVRKQRELAAEKRKAEQAAAEAAAAGRVLFSFSNAFMWLHAHLLRSQQASAESADALSCGCAGLRVLVSWNDKNQANSTRQASIIKGMREKGVIEWRQDQPWDASGSASKLCRRLPRPNPSASASARLT